MALDGLITKQRLLFVTSLYNELMRVLSAEASSNSSTATGLPLPPTAMRVSKSRQLVPMRQAPVCARQHRADKAAGLQPVFSRCALRPGR